MRMLSVAGSLALGVSSEMHGMDAQSLFRHTPVLRELPAEAPAILTERIQPVDPSPKRKAAKPQGPSQSFILADTAQLVPTEVPPAAATPGVPATMPEPPLPNGTPGLSDPEIPILVDDGDPFVVPQMAGSIPIAKAQRAYPRPTIERNPDEAVIETADVPLRRAPSLWDLAELEDPLFNSGGVTEFFQQVAGYGTWNVRPHFSAAAFYDGNVFISDKDARDDIVITASPGLAVQLGTPESTFSLSGDYTATGVMLVNNFDESSLDHSARLELKWQMAKLTLGLKLGFTGSSGTSIDASDRVRRFVYVGSFSAGYQLDEKFSINFSADYRLTEYENLIGSNEARLQLYVDYSYSPKLTFGLGVGYGYTEAEGAGTQPSESVSFRTTYFATGKLTISGNMGVEFRQYPNGGGDSVSPVFGLDFSWAAREGTNVTLSARRQIYTSAIFAGQNYTSTGVTLSIQQRVMNRFNTFLTVGYENLAYEAVESGVAASREDDYFYVRFGLQFQPMARVGLGLFYEYSQNASTGEGARGFERDRIGTQVSVAF